MNNNKQSIKLYTEDQLRKAFIDGMEFIPVNPLKYEQDANEYISELTPIEIPTDEEIEKAYEFLGDWTAKEIMQRSTSFKHGANYVLNKIKGGKNE